MKVKNRNRPDSTFSYRTMALAAAPTEFVIHSAPAKPKPKATADLTGIAKIDKMVMLGKAAKAQGKTVIGTAAICYTSDSPVIAFGGGLVWRDTATGRFCPSPLNKGV